MRYCNGCGHQIRTENLFCPNCGFKQLKLAKSVDKNDDLINDNNLIIPEDSIKQEDFNQETMEDQSDFKKKSFKPIGIILIISILFGGLMFYIISHRNPENTYESAADSVLVDSLSAFQNTDSTEIIGTELRDIVSYLDKKQTLFLAPLIDGRSVMTRSYFGDLNGDGIEDALVEWGLMARGKELDNGGGNANISPYFMRGFSVYLKIGNAYVLKADKRDDSFEEENLSNYMVESIENGKIICSTPSYADADPRCCPSLKETIFLVFQNNEILKPNQVPIMSPSGN
jgi:hypothetical protein